MSGSIIDAMRFDDPSPLEVAKAVTGALGDLERMFFAAGLGNDLDNKELSFLLPTSYFDGGELAGIISFFELWTNHIGGVRMHDMKLERRHLGEVKEGEKVVLTVDIGWPTGYPVPIKVLLAMLLDHAWLQALDEEGEEILVNRVPVYVKGDVL